MLIWLTSFVYAQEPLPSWKGLGEGGVATFKSLETIFSNILTIATTLAGIAVFIMLIAGGFGYLTSGGDPEKVKKSTATITGAIIGLIILIAIWFILQFVEEFTGVRITKFEIPGT